MTMSNGTDLPSWKYRRRATFMVLYFGAAVLLYILLSGDNRQVLDTVVLAVAGLMGAALSVYTGASAYQDVRLSRYQQRPYAVGPSTEADPYDPHY